MPNFPLYWLDAGIILDLLFALQIHLMKSGKTGQQLKALYHEKNHRWGDHAAFAVPATIGIIFPPYMLAGLIYFCVRVKQERDKLPPDEPEAKAGQTAGTTADMTWTTKRTKLPADPQIPVASPAGQQPSGSQRGHAYEEPRSRRTRSRQ